MSSRPSSLRPALPALFALFLCPLLFTSQGCVYFNTFFNGEKAYKRALKMKDERLEKNPLDSVLASPEERVKLDTAIAKASKVLELYPDKKKYQPKALFLIGESYRALGEYAKAVQKYEELQKHYPAAEEGPVAEFQRARCLFLGGQYVFAKPALEKVAATAKSDDFRDEALSLLAQLESRDNSPAAALALYEKLAVRQGGKAERRARARFEAARIAYDLKRWEKSRAHARSPDLEVLPVLLRYRSALLAADCLFKLGRAEEGNRELEALTRNRTFGPYIAETRLRLAEGYQAAGKTAAAVKIWSEIPLGAPKTAFAAEAYFRLGDHALNTVRDEKKARQHFDSAAAAGETFEWALKAKERSAALEQLAKLREDAAKKKPGTPEKRSSDFMIAELFLFRLDRLDSALLRLDRIVRDTSRDTALTLRAAYARAFIQDEFAKNPRLADSLYRFVLARYPATEYAKQAEANLGLPPSVQTDEDRAKALFLRAEKLRDEGADLVQTVIPAYRAVTVSFPKTEMGARAQYAVAALFEEARLAEASPNPASRSILDSAKLAYVAVRDRYGKSPYAQVAREKLEAAGVKAPAEAAVAAAPGTAGTDPAADPYAEGRGSGQAAGEGEGGEPEVVREELEGEEPVAAPAIPAPRVGPKTPLPPSTPAAASSPGTEVPPALPPPSPPGGQPSAPPAEKPASQTRQKELEKDPDYDSVDAY